MIERQFYLRVVSGVLRVAQASACPGRILAHSPSDVCSGLMNREFAVWSYSETRSTCNGYSVIVSAEGHGSVNELVAHHLVLSGVLRDAQTPANRHRSYTCIAHRPQNVLFSDIVDMHQTVPGAPKGNGYRGTGPYERVRSVNE